MRRWFKRRREPTVDEEVEEGEGQTAERKRSGWYLRFARQELKGWSPILKGKAVVLYLVGAAIVLIALGVPILTAATGVVEYAQRYDDQGPDNLRWRELSAQQREQRLQTAGDAGILASVNIQINRTMTAPVYLYYHLSTFHQNHKRYVRSRGDSQLGGHGNVTSTCQPQQYVNESSNSIPNYGGGNGGAINPCGLMAWSFFNDTFSATLSSPAQNQPVNLTINDTLIAWSNDAHHLYGDYLPFNWNTDASLRGGTNNAASAVDSPIVPLNQNQHFMVWMRPAAKPTVRKLWGVIDQTLPQGSTVTVNIVNRYNTYRFRGPKLVILSTNSWVGAKNTFLGIAYIACACMSFVAAIIFFIAYHLGVATNRKFGDINHLSWNRH